VTFPDVPASRSDDEPEASQPVVAKRVEAMIELQRHFAGPLPPPDALAGYEQVLPGAAKQIFAMAERQANHRQDLERVVVIGGHLRSWAGLVAGLVVALAFLFVSYRLIQDGHSLAGTVLGTVDLTGLVAVFVLGRASQRRDASMEGDAET
jgi:uncharacterized membrane protein